MEGAPLPSRACSNTDNYSSVRRQGTGQVNYFCAIPVSMHIVLVLEPASSRQGHPSQWFGNLPELVHLRRVPWRSVSIAAAKGLLPIVLRRGSSVDKADANVRGLVAFADAMLTPYICG